MSGILTFDTFQAGAVLLVFMVAGDWLAKKLKGRLPSVLIAGLFFMLVSWTGVFPENLMELGGFSSLTSVATALIITGMGASMSLRTFAANWRVVVLAVCSYLCQAGAILGILSCFMGFDTAVGALPGGSMTALIIQQRAAELGYDDTIVLSVLFFSTQAIVGSLLAGHYVRRESRRLLALPRTEDRRKEEEKPVAKALAFFDGSNYGNLCKLYILAWVSSKIGALIGVNSYILCLFLGVLGAAAGFVDQETIKRTGMENFLYFVMMGNIVAGFGRAAPEVFARMVLPVAAVFAIEVGVTCLFSPLLGKMLGFTREMSVALGSNIMMGFPLNMMLSTEIAQSLTDSEEERAYLSTEVASKMVIAGLSTTTSLAVFAGGLLANCMG